MSKSPESNESPNSKPKEKKRLKFVFDEKNDSLVVDKEDIMKMSMTLENVIDTLTQLFVTIEPGNDEDLVFCIGNTRSGKSTLLTSIVEGPESLRLEDLKIGKRGK